MSKTDDLMLKDTEASNLLRPQANVDRANLQAIKVCQHRLQDALVRLERLVSPEAVGRIVQLREALEGFNVRISLVGQVKAGKTALTNAMIGIPNLLPSDVNPWTSVITSVHINTAQPMGKNAVFTFFTTDEWNKMVNVGGHLGEIAERTNHEKELEDLRSQVQLMQRRTKARLGRNFNLLLDGYHSFLGFSPEMIKKYVCLGEEDESEGRYADVTKSADLYINESYYELPTVLCDTPGVNDPFLLREAVTLENLSGSDICVVVLSAHQAFSTVDIALLRILLALKHEQLVLFVNRIDELQDPDRQVMEIDGYIRTLLEEQNLPRNLPIVFGSAAWAEVASAGTTDMVTASSGKALHALARDRVERLRAEGHTPEAQPVWGSSENTRTKTTDFSGLHELQNVLQEKSALSVGKPKLQGLRSQALDIAQQSLLYLQEASSAKSSLKADLDFAGFFDTLDTILQQADEACTVIAHELSDKVAYMMSNAFREFMQRESKSLRGHLNAKKDLRDWSADSEQLRRALNLAHDEFVALAPKRVNAVFAKTADQIEKIYSMVLDDNGKLFSVHPPTSQTPKTPVSLMRTMAVDIHSGWFSGWYKKKFDPESYVKKFEDITQAEMQATLHDMHDVYVTAFVKRIRAQLHEFLSEHIRTLQNLSVLGGEHQRIEVLRQLGVDTEIRQRLAELESVIGDLKNLFHKPAESEMDRAKSVA